MSKRAEEAAKEIYKDGIELFGRRDKSGNLVIHPEIMVGILRNAAARGYEQAEKDLALTWEDAKKIDDLFMGVATLFAMVGRKKDILEQPYYEEVAKRFMEQRKK